MGGSKRIEGGFFFGEDLYAVDNANRKVYLYRMGEPTGTVSAAAELTFDQFIRCTDSGDTKTGNKTSAQIN